MGASAVLVAAAVVGAVVVSRSGATLTLAIGLSIRTGAAAFVPPRLRCR